MRVSIKVTNNVAALQPGAPAPGGKAIAEGLVEIGAFLERAVKERTPVGVFGARGGLRGSIFSEPRGNPIREVLVGSTSLYAPIVERGRRPGRRPPLASIQLWVEKKLGIADPKEAKVVAYLVARKIGREGFEGAHMFERAVREGEPVIQRIVAEMGGRMVIEWGEQ